MLTIRLRNGWEITPTTGTLLCVTPMEHPTMGLVLEQMTEVTRRSLVVDEAEAS